MAMAAAEASLESLNRFKSPCKLVLNINLLHVSGADDGVGILDAV